MLVPDPKVVRRLLTRYACLQIALSERQTHQSAQELEDVSYTLCVMMGTRSVHEAIVAGDALLVTRSGWESAQDPDVGHGLPMPSEMPQPVRPSM